MSDNEVKWTVGPPPEIAGEEFLIDEDGVLAIAYLSKHGTWWDGDHPIDDSVKNADRHILLNDLSNLKTRPKP